MNRASWGLTFLSRPHFWIRDKNCRTLRQRVLVDPVPSRHSGSDPDVDVRSLWLEVKLVVDNFRHLGESEFVTDIELDNPINVFDKRAAMISERPHFHTTRHCDEPRVQSTLKGFTKVCQRLQRLGEAKGFTTSACGASVSIAKDVQWW